MSDVSDDVTSPSPADASVTMTTSKPREAVSTSLTYAKYYKKLDWDRSSAYLPLPFHCHQRLPTTDERLLLPLVHSILLQRHHHQQQQQQLRQLHAASVRQPAVKLNSLHDGLVVAGVAQTSPARPVGATVDVSTALPLYHCAECGRAYSTASNLARHRQSHRSTIINHQQQERRSASPDNSGVASRKCPHCDKVYASAPAYSMHVRTHSQGCECPQCGKRFSRPWLLQGHIRTHTGEKPFRCPHCGKTFADKSNLRAHIQTHSTDKPHVCGRCGKAFALRSYLYKHEESSCMRSHRLYHGYAYLHHQQPPPPRRQRPLSPVLRASQIPCQL